MKFMSLLRVFLKYVFIFLLLTTVWILVVELFIRPRRYLVNAFERYSLWKIYFAIPVNAFLCGGCGVFLGSTFRIIAEKLKEKSSIKPTVKIISPAPTAVVAFTFRTRCVIGNYEHDVWSRIINFDPETNSPRELGYLSWNLWFNSEQQAHTELTKNINNMYRYIESSAIENIPVNTFEDVIHALEKYPNDNLMWYGILVDDDPENKSLNDNKDVNVLSANKRYLLWACVFQCQQSADKQIPSDIKTKLPPPHTCSLRFGMPALQEITHKVQAKLETNKTLPAQLLLALWVHSMNNRGGLYIGL